MTMVGRAERHYVWYRIGIQRIHTYTYTPSTQYVQRTKKRDIITFNKTLYFKNNAWAKTNVMVKSSHKSWQSELLMS